MARALCHFQMVGSFYHALQTTAHAWGSSDGRQARREATNHAPSKLATAINKSELTRDELSTYMLDSFHKTLGCPSNHLTDLKKAKAADDHKGTSFDSIQVLVSLEEQSVTHHLDKISLSAEQQAVNQKVLTSEFLTVFTHYIDDLYSTRDSDIKLDISKNVQSSRLRSTSIAIVGSIQQMKVNNLLKVLFDSGSDKTIFKRSSLPQGIKPSTGKKRKVSGMNTNSVIDQDVLLTDITLPEFFVVTMHSRSNSCYSHEYGYPIWLNHRDGCKCKLLVLTCTICLRQLSGTAFMFHDYFDDAQLHESFAEAMEECPFNSINDFFQWKSPFSQGISQKPFTVPCMNK
jgi:hypothetical protein